MSDYIIGVVGNPNCGKTTLFNELTGATQRVGNWPGVTIDRKSGNYTYDGKNIEVIDLPGIYSLSASSLDEEVARSYVLSGEADLIVNIIDASNLERNLYLSLLLAEMKIPLIFALNMMDTAKIHKIEINIQVLSNAFGCPVVPMVASKKKGIKALKSEINRAAKIKPVPYIKVKYPTAIRDAVKELIPLINDKVVDSIISGNVISTCANPIKGAAIKNKLDPGYTAIKLLEKDSQVTGFVNGKIIDKVEACTKQIKEKLDEEVDIITAGARYELIGDVMEKSVKKKSQVKKTISDKIDRIVLNRFMGIPIFLMAMYLMFMFTINIGNSFIDFFDIFSNTIFVEGFGSLLKVFHSPSWMIAVLAGGIGGGIQTVATFIPPIGFMFIFLSLLEDSGYMARGAFVMDRFMRVIGLPGKSFVPLLVGFGCNVPAIMATRTLENQRDRFITIMMNPFMSCGARLPVYALFAAAFFPVGGQNLVFLLYLLGIGFAVLTGFVLKTTTLKGEITPFVMELPPYHMPTVKGVLMRAWDRLKTFIFRAGKVIIVVVVVLSVLNSMGTDGTFGNENTSKSILSHIGRSITPIFTPMGIKRDNWPATVGIFTGVFAKEAVVGTLNDLYSRVDKIALGSNNEESEDKFDFWKGIKNAFVSIPENLKDVKNTLLDPLGLSVGNVSSEKVASEDQGVSISTFGSMVKLFDGKTGAFAYLLFILLYFPCCAAIAAVYRETNWKWTVFAGLWTTGIAYIAASVFYQSATLNRHPISSLFWIGSLIGCFLLVVFIMHQMGKGHKPEKAINQ